MIFKQFYVKLNPMKFRADILANNDKYTVDKKYTVLAVMNNENQYMVMITLDDGQMMPMDIGKLLFAGFVEEGDESAIPMEMPKKTNGKAKVKA